MSGWQMTFVTDCTWRSLEKGTTLLVSPFWSYVANHEVDSLTINLSLWGLPQLWYSRVYNVLKLLFPKTEPVFEKNNFKVEKYTYVS